MALLPKEHGAYGQMAFPLLTAYLVSGVSVASVAWGLAVVAGFIVHEPVLVLLGHRGRRARREMGSHALWAATAIGGLAAGCAIVAVMTTPPPVRWSFAVPALAALMVTIAVLSGREKSTGGELAVALTFSSAALPATMAAGASVPLAVSVALAFAVIFVVSTLAVRTVVLGVRGGGNPTAVRSTRVSVGLVSAGAVTGLWLAGWHELLPWTPVGAVAPALLFALAVAARPPRASALRTLGWSIMTVTTLATAILATGLVID